MGNENAGLILGPGEIASLERLGEAYFLGFTPARAKEFVLASYSEAHPADGGKGDGETDVPGDAAGKFEHYLREEKHFKGAVDVFWPHLKPLAVGLVTAAIETMRQEGTLPDGL